ncbi:MAG: AraC family ligand binding domain-containing protein, partial [Lachnospiraceae bacterium]|nr:AraC family ligand binding domain-containing protein [Lachnospiraceae bacterium]
MKEELMKLLRPVTQEEEEILKGNSKIKKQIYTDKKDFTIVSEKMLARGRLMDIRTHTRFVEFPKHKHDYIEIIYMCSGKTTHWVNDDTKIVLGQGELLFLNQHAAHAIEAADENDIAINFIILPEFFDVAFSMLEGENELRNFLIGSLMKDTGKSDYLHFKVADVLPVQNLIENMIWSLLMQQGHGRNINQISMGLLFLHLMNYTEKIEQHSDSQKESITAMTALRYIEDKYRMASLTELATELNVSV